jgi:hypothetical protein
MIEERNTRNSQFDNQLEFINTASEENAVPEKGAIVYTEFGNPAVFFGDGENWIQLATTNDIPTFNNGFQVAYDGQHTNVSNSQNITAVEQVLKNNVATSNGTLSVYNNDKFYFRADTIYTVTISFTSSLSVNNGHAQLFFGYSGIPYDGNAEVFDYSKGNNVAHQFTKTFQIVGDATSAESGISLYLFPSHSGKLWGAKFTIQKAF